MFKELFENKNTAIFDLNTLFVNMQYLWEESIEEVLQGVDIVWVKVNESFIPGYPIKKTWELILQDPLIRINIPTDTLVNNTYSKFIDKIKENGIELKPGFWDFIDELKNTKGFKLILKSIYNETITSNILEAADLEDIFNVISTAKVKDGEEIEINNVYTKIIKENKLNRENTIVFEESLEGAKESTREDMHTVILWDKQTPREKYTKDVVLFQEDFTELVGNLDLTYLESLENIQESTKITD